MAWYRRPAPPGIRRKNGRSSGETQGGGLRVNLDHMALGALLEFTEPAIGAHEPTWAFNLHPAMARAIKGARFNPKGVKHALPCTQAS